MLRFFVCVAVLIGLVLPAVARATNIATMPVGRMDLGWWQLRFEQTLAAKKSDREARVVWLGDSITQFWQREGTLGYDNILPVWEKYYAPYNALNFGFVGDTTASLIWRLDHGQVTGLHPALTIILIGANNLGHTHWGAALTVPGIEAVVSKTILLLPQTHVLLLGVLPSIRSPWVDAQTVAINGALAEIYSHNPNVTFINVAPVLTENGKVDASLYIDPKEVPPRPALHPDADGMARIAAYIAPVVAQWAGAEGK